MALTGYIVLILEYKNPFGEKNAHIFSILVILLLLRPTKMLRIL